MPEVDPRLQPGGSLPPWLEGWKYPFFGPVCTGGSEQNWTRDFSGDIHLAAPAIPPPFWPGITKVSVQFFGVDLAKTRTPIIASLVVGPAAGSPNIPISWSNWPYRRHNSGPGQTVLTLDQIATLEVHCDSLIMMPGTPMEFFMPYFGLLSGFCTVYFGGSFEGGADSQTLNLNGDPVDANGNTVPNVLDNGLLYHDPTPAGQPEIPDPAFTGQLVARINGFWNPFSRP